MQIEFKIGYLASLLVLIICSGCNFSDPRADRKEGSDKLGFRDASLGLPSAHMWRHHLAFFDINGDGHMDILAPRPRHSKSYQGPVVWYGNGKGEWKESPLKVPDTTSYGYGDIGVGDFDGDGIADIGLAMHGRGIKAFKGNAKGAYECFSEGLPVFREFASRALVCADFNGDGRSGIAAVSEGPFGGNFPEPSGIWVCSREKEKWQCAPVAANKEMRRRLFADNIVAGDVNGDGKTDLAIAPLVKMKNLVVWINEGNGHFAPFNEGLPQEKIYTSVALEDLNGDGKDDLVASISGFGRKGFKGLKAFLTGSDGFQEISDGLPVDEGYAAVTTGDLNGDGKSEIIGGTCAGGVKVFRQKGNGWKEMQTTDLPKKGMRDIYGIYCIDLNKDGYEDIVVNYAHAEEDLGGIRVFFSKVERE